MDQLGIYGSIASIIALPLAIYSIIVSLIAFKKYKPRFALQHKTIISNSLTKYPGLLVIYNDLPINNLTNTYFIFWNAGNKTIKFQDMAISDRLRIIFNDSYIFTAEPVFSTNQTCQIKTEIIDNTVNVEFDFLDRKQGGIIKITHTAKKYNDIKLYGTLMGYGSVKVAKFPINSDFNNAKESLKGLILLCFIIVLFIILNLIEITNPNIKMLIFLMGMLIIILSTVFIIRSFQIPKKVAKYLKENPI